jgi:hypothetical protein
MITNADLQRARREISAETRQPISASPATARFKGSYSTIALILIWLVFAFLAFFRHPHLQTLDLLPRSFWAIFGVWSVPLWSLLGEPVWVKAQMGQAALTTLWWTLYGSFGGIVGGGMVLYSMWRRAPASAQQWLDVQRELHRRQQGQLSADEANMLYSLPRKVAGLPLAQVTVKRQPITVGVSVQREMGHMVVIAPTRAGKGLHLTAVLQQWQHAALVIDPKAEQCERTAGARQLLGPVYNLPYHTLDLSNYYDWTNRNDLTELHRHLIQPQVDTQSIFAEKSRVLFDAAGKFAAAHGLNPLRVLLEAGNGDIRVALTAWETVAKNEVRTFTNGHSPKNLDDRFVSSALGTLTTRLYTYYQSLATLTTGTGRTAIPHDWAAQNGTVYVTYPLNQLTGVGGAIAAIVAGMMRFHMKHHAGVPLLVAIDELPAVGLRNLLTYLATVGGYGVTILLYAQTYGQLTQMYGREGVETLLANCRHQVWYPPADLTTADRMARLYGTELKEHVSFGRKRSGERFEINAGAKGETRSGQLRKDLVLDANAVMALDEEQVICRIGRKHVLRAQRLWPVPDLARLSAIPLVNLWPFPISQPPPIDWEDYKKQAVRK